MQRDPAPFGGTDVAEVMTEQRTVLVGQFRFEVSCRQPVSLFDAGEDFEARDGSRYTLALDPGQHGLMVERFAEPNDSAVELPVTLAKTAHLIDQRILKRSRVVACLEQWIRERLDMFWLWSSPA